MIQGTSVNIGSASLYINVNEAALAIERGVYYNLFYANNIILVYPDGIFC